MLPTPAVQLTRVHFYDPSRNAEIPTISREVFRCNLNTNTIIKKNIFGHRWVLKINESQEVQKQKCNGKVVVYIWVFCCIIVAIGFGIYFSIESKFSNKLNATTTSIDVPKEPTDETIVIPNLEYIEETEKDIRKLLIVNIPTVRTLEETAEDKNVITHITPHNEDNSSTPIGISMCDDCVKGEEICLKTEDFHVPICVKIRDRRDPSGCGGLCELNVQHCKRLHAKIEVFQCTKNRNILRCPEHTFNCGNMCIVRTRRCDGVIHCSNMADEKNCECDDNSYFHCGNGTSCIEKSRRCNGIVDCWDKSDELDCHRACQADEEPCSDGQCIKKGQFCDGIFHCRDKSDEPQGC